MKILAVGCAWCLISSVALAQDLETQVNAAIDKGVKHLLTFELPGTKLDIPGAGKNEQHYGAQALIGWTLLESGVSAKHPKVVAIADEVRKACTSLKYSYSISFSIIFLDKLGNPADSPLIKSLGVRLLAGQNKFGGWSYYCPYPNQKEQQRLAEYIAQVKDKTVEPAAPDKTTEKEKYLAVSEMLKHFQASPSFGDPTGTGDNSNTQVAMMALWVSRRHGIPASWALTEVEKRFRQTQLKSGNWPYMVQFGPAAPLPGNLPGKPPLAPPPLPGVLPGAGAEIEPKLPSMACAGLLGLALGQGVRDKERDLDDPVVKLGLTRVEKFLDEDLQRIHNLDINHYYCLFSLERMALVYGLDKINSKDWYAIGATNLVQLQKDGRWAGHYDHFGADTCFALLFLKKANVAKDLKKIITESGPRKSNKKADKDDGFVPLPLPLPKREKSKDPPERKSSQPKQSSLNVNPRMVDVASSRLTPASAPRFFVQPPLYRLM